MSRIIKKLLAGTLLAALIVVTAPAQRIISHAAEGKITFSDPSVTVGNTVTVTMKITSQEALGASDVMLSYDATKLEFVSGTGANGGAGSIRVVGSMEQEGQKSFSFSLKFKALKAGSTKISVAQNQVYDANSQAVTISHEGSSAVKVNAPVTYSKDANLSSLEISPGTLSPAFSPDVTSYTASVSGDVAELSVSAPAKDGKAKVEISGNKDIQVGENAIVCKVTAEDGSTVKEYTITVTKTEGTEQESDSETVSANAQASGMDVKVNGKSYQVAGTFDAAALPEGFETAEIEYGGSQIQAGQNDNKSLTVVYLTDDGGKGSFFLYDSEKKTFAPYVTVEMAEKTVTVLPIEYLPEEMKLPEGFAECSIDIGEDTVRGWIWKTDDSAAPEYCVVYAQNGETGERSLYRYDQKEMTLQRYFQDPDAKKAKDLYADLVGQFNGLLKDYAIRGWMIVALFAICLILIIILIVLLLRKPKNPGFRDYDYADRTQAAGGRTGKKAARSWEDDYGDGEDYERDGSGRDNYGRDGSSRDGSSRYEESAGYDDDGRYRRPAEGPDGPDRTGGGRGSDTRGSNARGNDTRGNGKKRRADRLRFDDGAYSEGYIENLDDAFDDFPDDIIDERPPGWEQDYGSPKKASKSVEELEKDIAAGLAREASGASGQRGTRRPPRGERANTNRPPADEDDLEFIDLDL